MNPSLASAKRQRVRAFTLIETLVVILIIGVLAAYFGQNLFIQTDDAKVSLAETTLVHSIPLALASAVSAGGYHQVYVASTGATVEPLLWKRGIKPETPWGERWMMEMFNGYPEPPVVHYPTGNGADGFKRAQAIAKYLNQARNDSILSATAKRSLKDSVFNFTKGDPGVAVKYRLK